MYHILHEQNNHTEETGKTGTPFPPKRISEKTVQRQPCYDVRIMQSYKAPRPSDTKRCIQRNVKAVLQTPCGTVEGYSGTPGSMRALINEDPPVGIIARAFVHNIKEQDVEAPDTDHPGRKKTERRAIDQCAEPHALVQFLKKYSSSINNDVLYDLTFTEVINSLPEKAPYPMSPCNVCKQWVQDNKGLDEKVMMANILKGSGFNFPESRKQLWEERLQREAEQREQARRERERREAEEQQRRQAEAKAKKNAETAAKWENIEKIETGLCALLGIEDTGKIKALLSIICTDCTLSKDNMSWSGTVGEMPITFPQDSVSDWYDALEATGSLDQFMTELEKVEYDDPVPDPHADSKKDAA